MRFSRAWRTSDHPDSPHAAAGAMPVRPMSRWGGQVSSIILAARRMDDAHEAQASAAALPPLAFVLPLALRSSLAISARAFRRVAVS